MFAAQTLHLWRAVVGSTPGTALHSWKSQQFIFQYLIGDKRYTHNGKKKINKHLTELRCDIKGNTEMGVSHLVCGNLGKG